MNSFSFDLPRIVIAAPSSGSGKTTVTLALMAAFKQKGLKIQGYKCGPDYIDPGYHTTITNVPSRNLDSWFVPPDKIKKIFVNHSSKSDLSIIEGVMGLFDGKSPLNNTGSTAEISRILKAPVILVLNARSMARSAAAIIKGFQAFSRNVFIAGIILNQCGSKSHIEILKEAIEKECKIPVLGGILRSETIKVPERHLGLLPAMERGDLKPFFKELKALAENSLDLDKILEVARNAPGISLRNTKLTESSSLKKGNQSVHIAVAYDSAFNFYYPENFDLMKEYGLNPVFFSPLKNEPVPENTHGLYLGGGFPEEFARVLSKNKIALKSIQLAIKNGMPSFAECGGYMYLTEYIKIKNKSYPMCKIVPGYVEMMTTRTALGYREISGSRDNFLLPENSVIKGHEFHYSKYHSLSNEVSFAYTVKGRNQTGPSGYQSFNLIAGYPHLYFLSNPVILKNWYNKCKEFKNG